MYFKDWVDKRMDAVVAVLHGVVVVATALVYCPIQCIWTIVARMSVLVVDTQLGVLDGGT